MLLAAASSFHRQPCLSPESMKKWRIDRLPMACGDEKCSLSLPQRRYQTTHAEVVTTFRRPGVTRAELLQVVDEIRASVEVSESGLS